MNIKKLFASVTSVLMLATMLPVSTFAATYSDELEGAYDYAYENGITTMDSIDNANMYGSLTRIALAKMIANYAMDVLGLTPDTDKECSFPDVSDSLDAQYDDWVTNACQLGLMGVGITNFNPYGIVTRAEFGTVLSRALRGDEYDGATPYYADHLDALKDAGIMTNISNPSMTEVRGYVMLMMQRAEEDATPAACLDPMVQIACALNPEDDACPAECRDLEDDEEEIEKAWSLEVTLSDETPDSATIPALAAWVKIASFDFEAWDEDVSVNSLIVKRTGLGNDNSVTNIALFWDNGRITKAKTFNTSTDEATLVLSPALEIKAGRTETIHVVATIWSTAYAWDEFAMQIKEVEAIDSTAEDVDGNFPITAETMKVASVAAWTVAIATDWTPSNVKLGEEDAEILKFKLSENSTANEDIKVSSITLKEVWTIDEKTELENYSLYVGTEKLDTVASISDKYLTFTFDEVTITDGNNKKFVVKADVIWWAGKNIDFELENDLDITAVGTQYGYGAQVTWRSTFNPTAVAVDAWEVTVTYTDPSSTEVRKDKDNVELGRFTIASAAGKDLELQQIRITIEDQSTGPVNVSTLLENVELYDTKVGTIYDLVSAGAGTSEIFQDTDVTIPLGTSKTFAIRVDTKDVDLWNAKFVAKLVNLWSIINESLDIRETEDDTQVTDITPSAITFKAVTAEQSSASVSTIVMSDTTAVIWTNGIEVGQFQVSASNATSLDFSEATVHLAVATAADPKPLTQTITIAAGNVSDGDTVVIDWTTYEFDNDSSITAGRTSVTIGASNNDSASNLQAAISSSKAKATVSTNVVTVTNNTKWDTPTAIATITKVGTNITIATTQASVWTKVTNAQVSAVYLMKWTTELDKVSGSQLADWVATFNGFNDTIAKNGKTTYTVKVDLVDDINQDTKRLSASLQTLELEDDDGDTVVSDWLPWYSSRDVTISTAGTLNIAVDNTDTETDKVKNVLGNTTTPFVASYELSATNEDVLVKDLQIVATESTANDFVNSVSELVLFANDKTTEIGREPVTSTTVLFDNVDYVATEWNTNVYVKMVTRKIGKDSAGVQTADITLTLQATDVEWDESGKAITLGNWIVGPTSASLAFSVLPVRISSIAFVNTFGWETVSSSLTNGENTVGIIAVTTDASTNTKTNGTSLKTELESMKLTLNTDAKYDDSTANVADITAITVNKVNGTTAATSVTQWNATALPVAAPGWTVVSNINLFNGVALGVDEELENGTTVYYVVKVTMAGLDSTENKYFQLKLVDLDNAGTATVEYSSTDYDDNETYNGTDNIKSLRIGSTNLNGPSLSSNY